MISLQYYRAFAVSIVKLTLKTDVCQSINSLSTFSKVLSCSSNMVGSLMIYI